MDKNEKDDETPYVTESTELKIIDPKSELPKQDKNDTQQDVDRHYNNNQPPPQYYYSGTPAYQPQVIYVQPVPPPPANAARQPTYRRGNRGYDDEYYYDGGQFGSTFSTREIRNKFVRKVYSIISIQLLFTFGLIATCVLVDDIRFFITRHFYLMFIGYALFFVTYIMLVCCQGLRKSFPCNIILLALLTLGMAYIFATMSAFYNTYIVLISMGLTFLVAVLITLIALTPIDITGWGIYLCLILFIFSIAALIGMIVGFFVGLPKVLIVIYGAGITIIFSLYLLYDTQQILGGKKIEMSPEEYIYGAICLYIDVMYIFYGLLCLMNTSSS